MADLGTGEAVLESVPPAQMLIKKKDLSIKNIYIILVCVCDFFVFFDVSARVE